SEDSVTTGSTLGCGPPPDFHALAFDPHDTTNVLVGSDGGVWWSDDRGGRAAPGAPLEDATWVTVNAFGLSIGQFTSIATNPAWTGVFPSRVWGGTQDNG